MKSCASCGDPLASTNPKARYCSTRCRTAGTRARAKGVPELRPAVAAQPTGGTVHAATLRELEAAGRADTALGAKALALASRIDAGLDTGSALAAMVKQHDSTMADAVRGAALAASPLDELRRRRDAKLNAG